MLLMMFYTCVAGWMLKYFVSTAMGEFEGLDPAGVGAAFGGLLGDPVTMAVYTVIVIIFGFAIGIESNKLRLNLTC